jgi:hypothetical protein
MQRMRCSVAASKVSPTATSSTATEGTFRYLAYTELRALSSSTSPSATSYTHTSEPTLSGKVSSFSYHSDPQYPAMDGSQTEDESQSLRQSDYCALSTLISSFMSSVRVFPPFYGHNETMCNATSCTSALNTQADVEVTRLSFPSPTMLTMTPCRPFGRCGIAARTTCRAIQVSALNHLQPLSNNANVTTEIARNSLHQRHRRK